jgi:hypothetical protein
MTGHIPGIGDGVLRTGRADARPVEPPCGYRANPVV